MSRPTIYLLDDEESLVELHCEMAELAGFNAQGFTRASQLFEQVTKFENSSIMMLDLHMPEMDGIEVIRQLAKMPNTPTLILLSGHDTGVLHSAEKLCRAHGLELIGCFRKPLSMDNLLHLFEQHIANTNIPNPGNQRPDTFYPTKVETAIQNLQQLIQDNQLILHFQPQIEIATGQLNGVEALVRWIHPEQGLIYPEHFLPLVEQSSMMNTLTRWVLSQAVKQGQLCQQAGFTMTVSVNMSALDITGLMLPEQLAQLLDDNKLDATQLTLEITESALMGKLVTSLDILTRLRLKGINLSIDDFGIGYSSLSQLHRIPFTELKIDRSFVCNMSEDDEARAIVKTCIMLGHELNMRVVAEGVETKQQFEMLKKMGCDLAQGYLIAEPMPGSDLITWAKTKQEMAIGHLY